MAKFKKKSGGGTPAISTASLPDIVFMLLFFFMVTTVMKETTLKVENKTPHATEIAKLQDKSLVSYIYIGKPLKALQPIFGTEPRIQLNDSYAFVQEIPAFIEGKKTGKSEPEISRMTTSLKVDKETKMGIVTDVKQELRKINALKINYSTKKTDKLK